MECTGYIRVVNRLLSGTAWVLWELVGNGGALAILKRPAVRLVLCQVAAVQSCGCCDAACSVLKQMLHALVAEVPAMGCIASHLSGSTPGARTASPPRYPGPAHDGSNCSEPSNLGA